MDSKREKKVLSGFVLIDKPSGPTSHDIIDKLRRITGIKKIGHAGTLDPFASGLLIVAVGRESTRQISMYAKLDKTYLATLYLGAETDTYDLTGKIVRDYSEKNVPSENEIKKVLKKFVGKLEQVPPMFSAKKINGKKLYELARKGVEVERKPCEIEIYSIKLIKYSWPELLIEARVSSGTYIRSLAFDIGKTLRVGAYLKKLERTQIGKFNKKDSYSTDFLKNKNWEDFILSN